MFIKAKSIAWLRIIPLLVLSNNLFANCLVGIQQSGQQNCTDIVADAARLECFDKKYGTPSHLAHQSGRQSEQLSEQQPVMPENVKLAYAYDNLRPDDHVGLVVNQFGSINNPDVFISSTAIGTLVYDPMLLISCVDKITRLQIILNEPISANKVELQFKRDGERGGRKQSTYVWQSLDNGYVIDAGRGLYSIDLIKSLFNTKYLWVDLQDIDIGLLQFNIDGLVNKIKGLRATCRW